MARKKLLLIVPIIGIAIFAFLYMTVINPQITVAELVVDSGTVQVMHSGGEWSQAQNGMLLKEGDSVRTLEDSEAAIIFFESSIMRLGPETEIAIQKLDPTPDNTFIVIKQEMGQTWNKILRLSGIDGYDVETPTTVASVRGTGFSVTVGSGGDTDVKLVEGMLNASSYKLEAGKRRIVSRLLLRKGEMVRVRRGEVNASLKSLALVRDSFIESSLARDEQFIQQVKARLLERFSVVLPVIKQNYNLTDREVSDGLDMYLRGENLEFAPKIVTRFLERRSSLTEVVSRLTSVEIYRKETLTPAGNPDDTPPPEGNDDSPADPGVLDAPKNDTPSDTGMMNDSVKNESLSNSTLKNDSVKNDTNSSSVVSGNSGSGDSPSHEPDSGVYDDPPVLG